MSITNEDVVNYLGNMSVMDLIALTKDLERQWGVEAKPQVQQTVTPPPTDNKVEQTEFNVSLVSFPADKKIALVKLVREVLGLGLVDSKGLVESTLPKVIKENLSKEDANALKAKFAEVGAVIEVK